MGEGLKQEKQGGSFSLSFGGISPPCTHGTFLTRCQAGRGAAQAQAEPQRLRGPEGNLQLSAKGDVRLWPPSQCLTDRPGTRHVPTKLFPKPTRRRIGSSSTPGLRRGSMFCVSLGA